MGKKDSVFVDNPPGLREKLSAARVGVAGCGGIGSNVALLLARAGVASLVLADHDRVEERNLNRQCYFRRHVGMPKVEALRQEILDIGGGTRVRALERRIDERNASRLFKGCGVLVEALDLDESKEMLLEAWLSAFPGTPVVACSGVAGIGDASMIRADRRAGLTMVGDGVSLLNLGTLSARVCLVASVMALEVVRILSGHVSRCGTCEEPCFNGVKVESNGTPVPLSGFPAKALEGALRGLLSAYRGVDHRGSIEIRLSESSR